MKRTKKILCMCMAALLLAGCSAPAETSSKADGSSSSQASSQAVSSQAGEEPDPWAEAAADPWAAYPEQVVYTVGKQAPDASYSVLDGTEYEGDDEANNIRTRFYEKHLNAKMEVAFSAAAGEAYDQQVSMAIVSGEIPDIMMVTDRATLVQLAENDLIADLTEVYDATISDVTRDIYESYDNRPLKDATIDGKLMAIPGTCIDTGAEMLWLRQDWMDKLSLSAPKTMEDVEKILDAFVNQDPDGNGQNDTVGLALSNSIYGKYGSTVLYANNVFTACGAVPGQWYEKDGEVVYGSVQPEMKDGLKVLADWYAKGLIDPQMAVRNFDDSTALLVNGQCGAAFGPWWLANYAGQTHLVDANARWTPYVLPTGEDGKVTMFTNNPSENYLVVRKDFEHPELLVKMLNYTYDYTRFSEHKNDEECLEFEAPYDSAIYLRSLGPISVNLDYFDAINRAYDDITAYQAGEEVDTFPWVIQSAELAGAAMEKLESGQVADIGIYEMISYYGRCLAGEVLKENPVNVVYPVFFGVTASMQTKWESLSKLESETMLKIITGEQPLEHFDEFVSTWKSAGGDAITQEVVESIGE